MLNAIKKRQRDYSRIINKKFLTMIFIIFLVLFFSGCTSNNIENDPINMDWLINHIPVHSLGTGNDDFWINYPTSNPNSSQPVTHLSWVNDSIEEGCVLFVVHKTGCETCQPQADRMISLAEKYEGYVVFHDLDIALGSTIEQRAYDSYLYDADGPPGYIALTGIFTLINDSGNIEYGWHSWEMDVDSEVLEEWIKDGIYYWNENNGGIR
jgi:hypothetical protein